MLSNENSLSKPQEVKFKSTLTNFITEFKIKWDTKVELNKIKKKELKHNKCLSDAPSQKSHKHKASGNGEDNLGLENGSQWG